MELNHYFNPVDFSRFRNENQDFSSHLLGFAIEKSTINFTSAGQFDVAIIGVPFDSQNNEHSKSDEPDNIRERLFCLPNLEREIKIIDFGNLKEGRNRRGNYLALRNIVEYLVEMKVEVVIIGGSQDYTVGICEAFKSEKYFSLSVVDALLDVKRGKENFNSSNFLTRIFKSNPALFQFNLIGYQRHLIPRELFNKTIGVNQHMGLGAIHERLVEVEPILRNTDVLSFDLGTIKNCDAPGNRQRNPNGLRSEEACMLARYAGLSERLKIFGLFETGGIEMDGISSQLLAEIIWYFFDGVSGKRKETVWSSDDKVVYKVAIKELDFPLVFFHEPLANRWWIEINSTNGEKKVMACSEIEYQKAANNEISELWLKYVQKMDELSK